MKMTRKLAALFAACAILLGAVVIASAQDKSKTYLTLREFKLENIDGGEVTLNDDRFSHGDKGKRVAFAFLNTHADIAIDQAKRVFKQREKIGGDLVFICGGSQRDVRDLRVSLSQEYPGIENVLWLRPRSADKVGSKFAEVFQYEADLDRVPALVVIDELRKAVHASMGVIDNEAIAEGLQSTRE